jgi:hypothetical protein
VQASLDRLGGDVQQLRFDDARADRAALDQYETSKCGRPAVTTTT